MAKFDQISITEQQIIENFIDHLWMENGLSENTLSAYRNDLAGFALWLGVQHGLLKNATTSMIQDFLAHNYQLQQKAPLCGAITVDITSFLSLSSA